MPPLIIELEGKVPEVDERAWLAPTAVLIGDVRVEAGASIWFGAVLRADLDSISVGVGASVQDNVVVHVAPGCPVEIEEEATVGHGAVLEACTVRAGALIGIGAVALRNSEVGAGALVAAGAVVGESATVPAGMVVAGVPARPVKEIEGEPLERVRDGSGLYRALSERYREGTTIVGETLPRTDVRR